MEPRDLTPDAARAEVEAFLGEGWGVDAHAANDPCLGGVRAWLHSPSGALVSLHSDATTLREAVPALKAAWRDALRPWVRDAWSRGYGASRAVNVHGDMARVLKEDSK